MAANGHRVDFLNLSIFNLPRFCDLNVRKGEFHMEPEDFPDDGAIRLYRRFTCDGVSPRKEARQFLEDTFKKHPEIKRLVLRTPRWMRAAHLAMMERATR